MEIDPNYEGKIARMRNLSMFKDKTKEEIYAVIKKREEEKKAKDYIMPKANSSYETRYTKLFDALQAEFAVDMNNSNDAEALKNLIRHTLQLEATDAEIREIQESGESISFDDTKILKNLSDIQRSLIMSITDLQDRLGISRKARKEKSTDDIPQFIEGLKDKAKNFWERKTVPIRCEKCEIELFRYWENFPKQKNTISLTLECWKCEEKILYVR